MKKSEFLKVHFPHSTLKHINGALYGVLDLRDMFPYVNLNTEALSMVHNVLDKTLWTIAVTPHRDITSYFNSFCLVANPDELTQSLFGSFMIRANIHLDEVADMFN